MNLHKTKIEWCTHTWNPVTGCRHGCFYCYAEALAKRFCPHAVERPMNPEAITEDAEAPGCVIVTEPVKLADETGAYTRSTPYPKSFAPTLNRYTMSYPEKRLTSARVFVSSMGDLFGEWVPDEWIAEVFEACKRAPWHTFMFLTKNPARYAELYKKGTLPVEPNFWYGATATEVEMMDKVSAAVWDLPLEVNTFLSLEPLMSDITGAEGWGASMLSPGGRCFDWIIVGAMTGPARKKAPVPREWVERIVDDTKATNVPVFMKDSLKPIWGDDIIREYPKWSWPEVCE